MRSCIIARALAAMSFQRPPWQCLGARPPQVPPPKKRPASSGAGGSGDEGVEVAEEAPSASGAPPPLSRKDFRKIDKILTYCLRHEQHGAWMPFTNLMSDERFQDWYEAEVLEVIQTCYRRRDRRFELRDQPAVGRVVRLSPACLLSRRELALVPEFPP